MALPEHERIAARLRGDILRGVYNPGQALPTEADMVQTFGAGRSVVRRAIRMLRQEGLLTVRRGRGMFVQLRRHGAVRYKPSQPRGGPYQTLTGPLAGSIRPQGVDRIEATRREARWLAIDEGTEVIVRRRYLVGDDETPLQTYDSYLPLDLIADTPLAGPGVAHGGVYATLHRVGLTPVKLSEEVTTRMPMPEEAAVLGLGERSPVLEIVRFTRIASGRVIEALHIVSSGPRTVAIYDELPIHAEYIS
jgi:GntR family transcriptional regulator